MTTINRVKTSGPPDFNVSGVDPMAPHIAMMIGLLLTIVGRPDEGHQFADFADHILHWQEKNGIKTEGMEKYEQSRGAGRPEDPPAVGRDPSGGHG